MSEGRLPQLIEPRKLAQQELALHGHIRSTDLPRVLDSVLELGRVECALSFRMDQQYRHLVAGTLVTEAKLSCQRCLDAVPMSIHVDVNACVVRDEAKAKALPSFLDPWLAVDGEADLYAFIEEELLLNIPLIALHDQGCIDPSLYSAGAKVEVVEEVEDNPFVVLGKLKKGSAKKADKS